MKIKNILFSFIVFLSAIFTAKSAEINGLVGQYYANRNLEGEPIYRVDENLNFNWGTGSPMEGIPENDFSVRWTGSLEITTADEYVFSVSIDDGIRMYIDGEVIFDSWVDSDTTRISSPIFLDAGKHNIKVEYYEASSGSRIILSWKNSTSDYVVIPKENFYYNDSDTIPTITLQPQNKGVPSGRRTTLSTDTAESSVYFQWQYSIDGEIWNNIDGATQKNYKTPVIEEIDDGRLYRCLVTNALHPDKITYTNAIIVNSIVPETFYISTNGSDENDGMSWDTPFATLQKAINEAKNIGGGDIWVKSGEYDFGGEVELLEGVYIYGGFAGTEKSLEERVEGNESVISGGGTHQIFIAEGAERIKLENLTLCKAKNDNCGVIKATNSECVFEKITIRDCDSDGQVGAYGNCIFTITDCSFFNNIGRVINGCDNSKIDISGSSFESNVGVNSGGAILLLSNAKANIKDSAFKNNETTKSRGGAISSEGSNNYTISNSNFEGNKSLYEGGAIYAGNAGNVEIIDSKFLNNTSSSYGGAIFNRTSLKVNFCEFEGNKAISRGGAIANNNWCSTQCDNSTFIRNESNEGGAVYLFKVNPTWTNNTFYGNVGIVGDDVCSNSCTPTLRHCTIYSTIDSKSVSIQSVKLENSILWRDENGSVKPVIYNYSEGLIKDSVVFGGIENSTNISSKNPNLMPLGYYGGKVRIMPLSIGSSAIELCFSSEEIPSDVLGNARGEKFSAGAVEFVEYPEKIIIASKGRKFAKGYVFEINAFYTEEDATFQWYKNGVPIVGATDSLLRISQSEDSVEYTVAAFMNGKTVISSPIIIETGNSVIYVAKQGNNEYDGLSWNTAKSSISSALSLAVYGTEIWVAEGEYIESTTINIPEGVRILGGFIGNESKLSERKISPEKTIVSGNNVDTIFKCARSSGIHIENLTLIDGNGNNGGAISAISSILDIENVIFRNNKSISTGGAIYAFSSDVTLKDCKFFENLAAGGGAIECCGYSITNITNCSFDFNVSSANGGALEVITGSYVNITESEITNNATSESNYGGGLYLSNSSCDAKNVKFSNNYSKSGGGVYFSGKDGTFDSCLFYENIASSEGGAYWSSNNKQTIRNCTFTKNESDTGAFCIRGYNTSIVNCTVYDNRSSEIYNPTSGGGYFENSKIYNSIFWDNSGNVAFDGTVTAVNCIIEGGYKSGINIIDSDPKFAPLGYYGGFTNTLPVIEGSPAIANGATQNELGDDVTLPKEDARGIIRAEKPTIGATESTLALGYIYIESASSDTIYAEGETILLKFLETPNATFQWYKNGIALEGETSSILSINVSDKSEYYADITSNGKTYSSNIIKVDVRPRRLYVAADAPEGGDGLSWDTALPDIQTAIDLAGYGTEIWLMLGEYELTQSLNLRDGVSLYGGFLGTENDLTERLSTLKSTLGFYKEDSSDDYIENESLLYCKNVSDASVIDGIKFESKVISIYNYYSNPIIKNCIFYSEAYDMSCSVIYNFYSNPVIEKSLFTSDYTENIIRTQYGIPKIDSCYFENCSTYGAALLFEGSDGAIVVNCSFYQNGFSSGPYYSSSFIYAEDSSLNIGNSTFLDNHKNGIIPVFFIGYDSKFLVENCVIWDSKYYKHLKNCYKSFEINSNSVFLIKNSVFPSKIDVGENIYTRDPNLVALERIDEMGTMLIPTKDSDCIGNGNSLENIKYDSIGKKRSEKPTIGAIEHDETFIRLSMKEKAEAFSKNYEFTINAIVPSASSVKWYKNDVLLVNENSLSLTISQFEDEATYRAEAINSLGETLKSESIKIKTGNIGVVYVSSSGSDDNDGLTWVTSKATLQSAIDVVKSSYGAQIWIAEGLYIASDTLKISTPIKFYGGFSGSESTLDQRNNNVTTTISGIKDKRTFELENAEKILFDGITFEGANYTYLRVGGRTGTVIRDGKGACIHSTNTDVEINNCVFRNNEGRYGIALYCNTDNVCIVRESRFENNTGGALIYTNAENTSIQKCEFNTNTSSYNILSLYKGGTVSDCVFSKNSSDIIDFENVGSIDSCKFIENTGNSCITMYLSCAEIENCIFLNNNSGCFFNEMSWRQDFWDYNINEDSMYPILKNCVFAGNTKTVLSNKYSSPYFENCIFYNNTGSSVLQNRDYGYTTFVHCSFLNNYSTDSLQNTIYNDIDTSSTTIINSIIWTDNLDAGKPEIFGNANVINSIITNGFANGTNVSSENPLCIAVDNTEGVPIVMPALYSPALSSGAIQSEVSEKVILPKVDILGTNRITYNRPTIGAVEPEGSQIYATKVIPKEGNGSYFQNYEFTYEAYAVGARADSADFKFVWYKDGEIIEGENSYKLSDSISKGNEKYTFKLIRDGAVVAENSFEVKTYPSVVYLSANGDDSNDGSTPETAKRSLDALLRELPYGNPYVINAISNVPDSGEKNSVFTINGMYDIPDGVTLNIGDNCILKFTDNAGLNVLSGGTLNVGNSVIFTHIADDSIGGDTNADEGRSLPQYDKYTISGSGNIAIAEDCDWRYKSFEYGGTLSVSQIWQSGKVYHITSDLVIPENVSLNILEGAILKFDSGKRITVNTGGELFINGTLDSPVIFTSIKDDTRGGDTNGDGDKSIPSMGDWKNLQIFGKAEINYANFYYGGNTDNGSWTSSQGGALAYLSGSSGRISNCGIYDVKYDGIINYASGLAIENTTIAYCSRFINSLGGDCSARNCVFYYATGANSGGAVLAHGGNISMINCVVSYVTSGTFTYSNVVCSNNLFYNPKDIGPQSCSYVGANGNLWGDPLFRNIEILDFTLKVGSPCIDTGAGEFAPELDYFGQPRVQDSHVSGVGSPSENGAIPDIGIYEMTENAMSEVDIAANWIKYPETVSVGEYIDVVWMGTNVGSKKIQGNCKTTLSLVNDSTAEELELGQITNLINLAPSESGEFSAKIKVPQTAQDGVWKIKMVANSNRGIFEGRNTDNNTIVGDTLINVEMPIFEGNSITVGANSSATIKFSASESARCILITSPENLKIYGAARYVPNAQTFAVEATNCGNGIYALTIPASSESFYITFINESINSKTAAIEFGENSLSILGTSIDKLPNNGNVTFSIYGTGFTSRSTVDINKNGEELPVTKVEYVSANELSVTLSQEYAQVGDYQLVVSDGIAEIASDKKLTVLKTMVKADLKVWLEIPSAVRPGRINLGYICYSNDGDVNLEPKLITITGSALKARSTDSQYTDVLRFITWGNASERNIIRAKTEYKIPFYFKSGIIEGIDEFYSSNISEYIIKDTQISIIEDNLSNLYTKEYALYDYGSFLKILEQSAERIYKCGRNCYEVEDLLDFAQLQIDDNDKVFISGYLKDSKTNVGLSNIEVFFTSENGSLVPVKTDAYGYFEIKFCDSMTSYKLNTADNTIPDRDYLKTNFKDATDIVIYVNYVEKQDAKLNLITDEGIPVSSVNIIARNISSGEIEIATSDENGDVYFAELSEGKWNFQVEQNSFGYIDVDCTHTTDELKSHTTNINLRSNGVSFRGRLYDNHGKIMDYSRVRIVDQNNHTFTVTTNENGDFEFLSIPTGTYKVYSNINYVNTDFLLDEITITENLEYNLVNKYGASLSGSFDATQNIYAVMVAYRTGEKFFEKVSSDGTFQLDKIPSGECIVALLDSEGYYVSMVTDLIVLDTDVISLGRMEISESRKFVNAFSPKARSVIIPSWYEGRYELGFWDQVKFWQSIESILILKYKIDNFSIEPNDFSYFGCKNNKKIRSDLIDTKKYLQKEIDKALYNYDQIDITEEAINFAMKSVNFASKTAVLAAELSGASFLTVGLKISDSLIGIAGNALTLGTELKHACETLKSLSNDIGSKSNFDAISLIKSELDGMNDYASIVALVDSNIPLEKLNALQVAFDSYLTIMNRVEEGYSDSLIEAGIQFTGDVSAIGKNFSSLMGYIDSINEASSSLAALGNKYSGSILNVNRIENDLEFLKDYKSNYHDKCESDCVGLIDAHGLWQKHTCPCHHGTTHEHTPCPSSCDGLIQKNTETGEIKYLRHDCICEHGVEYYAPESLDPNEMSGPTGVGDDRKVLPGQWLDFKIHFENHSDATAAAQEIHITNMLSNYLDWSTFELGEIVFKNQIVTSLSGKNSGSAEVALSDGSQNVRMEFSLDPVTGKAYWYMRSVDPNTADGWPLDPYAGFLPPNDANGNGEGYVAYRVKVKDDAPNGATVDSTASIIFDYNEPIQTDPSWSNTVYVGAPTKPEVITIGEIVNGSTTLSWTAADFASSYDVYIWENGTERPSEATISDIQSTSISFNLEYINGNSYNFLVVAKNKYGETQSQISTAETKKVETYAKWSADNLIGFTADKRAKNVSSYNDNITNLEKYVFGLSGQKPTSFNENGNFKTYVGDDGVVRVRYPMRRYMSDASVKVSYSTDLKTWKTDQISTTLISEDEEISIYESELGGNQPKNIWFKVEAKEKN